MKWISRILLLSCVLGAVCGDATSQTLTRLTDLSQTPARPRGIPDKLFQRGALTYFVFATPNEGNELWVTDGSQTTLVRDIRLGPGSSNPDNFTPILGGVLMVFTADDGVHGREPWVTDGTAAGTRLLKDIRRGPATSFPTEFVAFGTDLRRIFFVANDGEHGNEIWRTSGTPGSTELRADLEVGPGDSNPRDLTTAQGNRDLVFTASESGRGREVYRFTDNGSTLRRLPELLPGNGSANPSNFGPHPRGGYVFSAVQAGAGRELFQVRNGTVRLVADIFSGPGSSEPSDFVLSGDRTYFIANDGQAGRELCMFDGSQVTVFDVNPGGDSSRIEGITALPNQPGRVVFLAEDGQNGRELMSSDGVTAGLLADLNPGRGSSLPLEFQASSLGVVFFVASDGSGRELFQTDGTRSGTFLAAVSNPGPGGGNPSELVIGPGGVPRFLARLPNLGDQIYRADLPNGSVDQITDLRPQTEGSDPRFLTVLEGTNRILFSARVPGFGRELMISDGTVQGTGMLVDLTPGLGETNPRQLVKTDSGRMFFVGDGAGNLMETDGTAAGSRRVTSVTLRNIEGLIAVGELLICSARDATRGFEPHVVDTRTGIATLLRDLRPGARSSDPNDFARLGNAVLFAATDDDVGRELFVTDGTPNGTRLLKDTQAGPGSGLPQDLVAINDEYVLFSATVPGSGVVLWVSDGQSDGTEPLLGSNRTVIRRPADFTHIPQSRRAVFSAETGTRERKLFRTNGRRDGTGLLGAPALGDDPEPRDFVQAGVHVYFTADDGERGRELWRTANDSGVTRVTDIQEGASPSMVSPAVIAGIGGGAETLFFANDGIHGFELWSTSGRRNQTERVLDFVPGTGSMQATAMLTAGDMMYLTADDGVEGQELYVIDQRVFGAAMVRDLARGCAGSTAPILTLENLPELTRRITLRLSRALPRTPAALLLGVQRSPFQNSCLPAMVPLELTPVQTNRSGEATTRLRFPNDTSLIGGTFQLQFAATDPSGGALGGFSLTNAIELVVGRNAPR